MAEAVSLLARAETWLRTYRPSLRISERGTLRSPDLEDFNMTGVQQNAGQADEFHDG